MFGWQVGDGECEGTQAIEPDDPALIVDGDENTRHIAFFVLTGTRMEPIIERSHPAWRGRKWQQAPVNCNRPQKRNGG